MIGNKNSLVVQHNKLIQAKYELSLQEKRFVLWLISQISSDDEDFKHYQVPIKELAKSIGLESIKYKRMAEITDHLMKRIITIEMIEEKKLIQIAWLRYAEYEYGKGVMKVGFAPELMPYLLQLKSNFTAFQLAAILSFSSLYAIRIYELLKQYEKIGSRTFGLPELKTCLGISENEYLKYNHFKDKVLRIALREINSKTDLHIEIEEIKESRRVAELCFYITPNPNYHEEKDALELLPPAKMVKVSPELINKLRYFGISQQKVLELATTYDEKTIWAKLQDFEKAMDVGKDIQNPAGWLLSAIEKDWSYRSPHQIEQEHQVQAEKERLEQENLKAAEKAKRETELKAKRTEFDKLTTAIFLSRWATLPAVAQAGIASQADFSQLERRSYETKGAEKSPFAMLKLKLVLLSEDELNFDKWLGNP